MCYNKAVPAALAALTGREVVVPPEPGLMGAFGVALEIDSRLEQGRLKCSSFALATLASRKVLPVESFICKGGKERCDNKCVVSLITVDGRKYPFGGICNRYDNLMQQGSVERADNLVATRSNLSSRRTKPSPRPAPRYG